MAPEDNPADDVEMVRCPATLGCAQCELPEGHEGPHYAEDHSYQSPGLPSLPNHVRCQHQDHDGNRDCIDFAVLCIHHGGHDACAVEIMHLQREIADLRRTVSQYKDQARISNYEPTP